MSSDKKSPKPVFDASDCIKSFTWWETTDLPFESLRFDIHQFSSSLQSRSRVTLLLQSLFKQKLRIYCLCRYFMYSGAGRIANAVDDIVPRSFSRSYIETYSIDNISWHILEIDSTFWDRYTVISTKSVIIPKNSIPCVGWRTDFFKFLTNPRSCTR